LTNSHTALLARSSYSDGANLAINVNLTGSCNLACTYCFADGGDYGRIRNSMQSHTVDAIFDFIRGHVTRSRVVRFEFFGGEPLLNFARIREICDRAHQFTAATDVQFIHRISTNLTVLPLEALALFADRNFIVSVSIDGGSTTHNRNRPTKGGQGSFEKILSNCKRVRTAGDGITLVARMTVVSSEPSLLDNVRELWSYNLFDYFQIYPGVTPAAGSSISSTCGGGLVQLGEPKPPRQTMHGGFLQQLSELLDHYPGLFQTGNRFRGVLEYERISEMVLTGKMALAYCSAGGTYFTFSPDDSIVPCHRLVGHPEFHASVGAAPEELSEWTLPVDRHPVCSTCWARYICGGGCRQENFVATGSLRQLNEETCLYQRRLAEGVIRTLAFATDTYRTMTRQLDDLFISCGRPVVANAREKRERRLEIDLRHFRPVGMAAKEEKVSCKAS
jgi:radical SAM protein with 4Fe4S-binding SPASM domain